MKKVFFILLFIFSSLVYSQNPFLDVRIYTSYHITSFQFTPVSGKYIVKSDDKKILDIYILNTVTFSFENEKIRIVKKGESLGLFENVEITGAGLQNIFKIEPGNSKPEARYYDDDLNVIADSNKITIINRVDVERYVSAVVQSEVHVNTENFAYYEIQAIITRTYALNNTLKHSKQGYNFCDEIHCQSYKRRCNNSDIIAATVKTAGMVIVDKNNKMISAAYYSNSGGETMNSEDIWAIPTTYLKSKKDSFSLKGRNAYWQRTMLKKDWLAFLASTYNYPVNDNEKVEKALNFTQDKRKTDFENAIPLKNIRKDLNLKSTFFNVNTRNDTVFLKGRGYGHGVGLSQEGAIKMIEAGYSFIDIIRFYYTGVNVVNIKTINK